MTRLLFPRAVMFTRACLGLLLLVSTYRMVSSGCDWHRSRYQSSRCGANAHAATGEWSSLLDCVRFRNAVQQSCGLA